MHFAPELFPWKINKMNESSRKCHKTHTKKRSRRLDLNKYANNLLIYHMFVLIMSAFTFFCDVSIIILQRKNILP